MLALLNLGASESVCGLVWLSCVGNDLGYLSPLNGTVATLALAQPSPQGTSCVLFGDSEMDPVLSFIPAIVGYGLGHSNLRSPF